MITTAARSTRDRPAKPPLGLDVVVQAALRVLQAEGLAAVTMRRVATELDTGPASLYAYVSGRDDLIGQMLETIWGGIPVPVVDPSRWREQLITLLRDSVQVLDDYPGIARAAFAHTPSGPHALAVAECTLTLLRAGGIEGKAAAWACDILALYVTAAAFETSVYVARGQQEPEPDAAPAPESRFTALSADRYPHIVALAGHMASGSGDERFAFGLHVIINGLLATDPG